MSTNQENLSSRTATTAEKHAYLIVLLTDYYKRLVDFAFKHATVLTLALGWIVSSEQAQRFMQASVVVRALSTVAILLYGALYSSWVCRQRLKSETAYEQLVALGFMESRYFEAKRIRKPLAYSFICLHSMICLCLITFIWVLPHIPSGVLFKKP